MTPFDAWFLPGLSDDDVATEEHSFADLPARIARLTPGQLGRVIAQITDARRSQLLLRPVRDIVTAIDAAAAILASPESEQGAQARALLPLATGYSPETIEDVLAHMTADWRAQSLDRLLASELGDPKVLDAPVQLSDFHGLALARGPQLAFHIFSGNVPGVAVTSIVRSLLVKSATLGKTAAGEPVLAVLFARALARIDPEVAQCLAVTYWPGGTRQLEDVALEHADAVVVYGGREAVDSVQGRISPAARLLVHGPRLSFGIVGRNAERTVAAPIARAVAAYDQQGCVSPHVVYVERGGPVSPRALAAAIAHGLAGLGGKFPRRKLSHAEALAIRAARTNAEFRLIGGAPVELFGADDAPYTVIYDEEATLPVSCLNRTLYVVPVSTAEAVLPLLEQRADLMQSVALAGFDAPRMATLASLFADVGVSRITSFDALPWPPMWWHHDGRGPLRELLTWTDIEA